MERTYTMIKPEAVADGNAGKIIARIEAGGYRIVAMKLTHLTQKDAEAFYEVHKERPFYGELTAYMCGGPIVAMVLEKDNCVNAYRQFIGATNPAEAAEGTIRKDFGKSIGENAIHASDSNENAAREVSFFFSERELVG
ncbi:MAG TPA: nucleoside-diphosphate kinase [Calditrichia bacterium]|nr:nucleoside-diphosphate kinase [Calditrichia bacterium]HQV33754.1 nucleoside-diphosphate kinase [Calditrichia bacterium]